MQTRSFDEDAKESRAAALRAANKSGTGFGESYSLANPSIRAGEDIPQPTIFNGKLKGYQLKGMNWLANLYEQVNFRTVSYLLSFVICFSKVIGSVYREMRTRYNLLDFILFPLAGIRKMSLYF